MRTCRAIRCHAPLAEPFACEDIVGTSLQLMPTSQIPLSRGKEFHTEHTCTGKVDVLDIMIAHSAPLGSGGGDAVGDGVVGCRSRKVVVLPCVFGREVEVVRALCLQRLVALHVDVAHHVEVGILLLQRRSTETTRISCPEDKGIQGISRRQFSRQLRSPFGIREVIPSSSANQFPSLAQKAIVLGIEVACVLHTNLAIGELVGMQIVAHVVASHGEDVLLTQGTVVHRANGHLQVAVIHHITIPKAQEVGLVVLIVGGRYFQTVLCGDVPLCTEAACEVAETLVHVHVGGQFLEVIPSTCRQGEIVRWRVLQLVLRAECAPSVHLSEIALVGIIHAHGVVVHRGVLHIQHIPHPALLQAQDTAIALLAMVGKTGIEVERPRFLSATRDDVYHTTHGTSAIEGGLRTTKYLYALHIVHVYAREVYILHCLACQALAIHQNEHALPGKATHVHVQFLVHGVGKLHTGKFLLEQVAQVGGICQFYVLAVYHTRKYGRVLQQFARPGGGDDQFFHTMVRVHGIRL